MKNVEDFPFVLGLPVLSKVEMTKVLGRILVLLLLGLASLCGDLLAVEAEIGKSIASTATSTVRVAIAQITVADGDVAANLTKIQSYVQKAARARSQIILFPELVDVGYGSIVKASTGGENAHPIPGETSDALGAVAVRYNVWIAAALLEKVPGGAYDTNVLIDNRGKVLLKQRKAFVYPVFGGTAVFQGNYQDAQVVDSPWGPIGLMNCMDTRSFSQAPSLCKAAPYSHAAHVCQSRRRLSCICQYAGQLNVIAR